MNINSLELIGTALFAIAVLHTFLVSFFQHIALKFREGSVGENFFHLLGEVEVVFGFWAAVLVLFVLFQKGLPTAVLFIDQADFTEPLFVFVIMAVAATKPITEFATFCIQSMARLLPLPREAAFYFSALVLGPLSGSLITEPAAMTVTALILRNRFFLESNKPSVKVPYQTSKLTNRFMYTTLGTLFVNISIGGVLTHFAAPPVLMVANTWNWTIHSVFTQFGWKAILAVCLNTVLSLSLNFSSLKELKSPSFKNQKTKTPIWLIFIHIVTLACIVVTAHYPKVFFGIFLFFLGITHITEEYQEELKLRQSLLVGFFLGGLIVLGQTQRWWLEIVLKKLDILSLFIGTTALTAFTDNAALTYLGSLIPNTSDAFKYALVAGAVSGGGLTVIANAPNPAGFSILRDCFGPEGISPIRLIIGAFIPTLIAMACFWFLP